ncbi:YqaA family protein [Stappia indica]|uniref:DedA family protein n=1 Tax=Stappia indica TaxID=538381 RepID=A0A857C3P2_9HYPH|nr:YqaA family protein [Stappia indica]QGZ33514.1 DedA family protein [Stappia indica]
MVEIGVYGGLFLSALGAATLLPMQSEAVLAGLLLSGRPVLLLIAVASLGNTLGGLVNWALGRGIERFRHRRWFPVGEAALTRAQGWYARWGKWSLLLSWMPIIGDPLTLAAGVMRERFATVLVLVAIAKTGRYAVLAAVTLGFFG